MAQSKEEMLRILDENIDRLEKKSFNVYFYVLDTKGNPSSSLEYIYQTALVLSKKGYNVTMLHQEKNFVGVGAWLGEEYAKLKHANIETDNVVTTPSDFLFIPEIFANVMAQTKKLACKRVMLVQNYNHISEFMTVAATPEDMGVLDAVVTTKAQAKKVKEYFPSIRTHVVSPSIKPLFRKSDALRKLIINVISREQSDVNQTVKPFYWTNPIYKWVSFRDLRGVTQEVFSEAMREAAITIWMDDKTNFGYSLLEALRCGGLVIAKVPTHPSEWMLDEKGQLTDKIIWFYDIDELPSMIASAVRSWTLDSVPMEVYEDQASFDGLYSEERQSAEIEDVYINGLFAKRLADFIEAKAEFEHNSDKTEE